MVLDRQIVIASLDARLHQLKRGGIAAALQKGSVRLDATDSVRLQAQAHVLVRKLLPLRILRWRVAHLGSDVADLRIVHGRSLRADLEILSLRAILGRVGRCLQ